jgi:hypothetical protein
VWKSVCPDVVYQYRAESKVLANPVVDVVDRLVEECRSAELNRKHVGVYRGWYRDMMTAVLQTECGDVRSQDRQIR